MATENPSTRQEQAPGAPQAGQQENKAGAQADTQAGTQVGTQAHAQSEAEAQGQARGEENFDGLADKKPEELTPDELRLMADTMPGEGPGD